MLCKCEMLESPRLSDEATRAGALRLCQRGKMHRSRDSEAVIVIARLPKGLIGEDNANIAGSLLVNAVQHAAMRRAAIHEENRIDFTTESFADILSELRKYHAAFVISGQFLAQMRPSVRAAIIGNIGTLIAFQLGHDDAGELQPSLG